MQVAGSVAPIEEALPKRAPGLLGALRFRDFRLLWMGLLISNLGTWMQFTATGYFVVKLSPTPQLGSFYLGVLGIARAIPVLLASPIAGVVADRLPRRRVLFVTNSTISALALLLAILTSLHAINIWGLITLSMLNAAAQSFDVPARQSWVPLLVDRDYIGNAIGLNSIAFNAPAVIGPAIAGVLIAYVGVAGSFYVNAAATLAVVVALLFMKSPAPSSTERESLLLSIRNGIAFLLSHAILRYVIIFFMVSALLVRPYSLVLPAYALNYLQADAKGLGWAIAATGVGGFGGALVTALFGSSERRGTLWLFSAMLMGLSVLALGFVRTLWISFPVLALIGLATLAFMGMSNILIQTLSPDAVRGRAVSVYSMIALGFVPAGAFVIGGLGSIIGLGHAFVFAGIATALFVSWLAVWRPVIRTV
ncbi:MAG: MFS transporter [Candidatus Eremiobacteraeota bacterium]|nr:MFS transporter [Candidatus Eremiobacteraeota bacterium]